MTELAVGEAGVAVYWLRGLVEGIGGVVHAGEGEGAAHAFLAVADAIIGVGVVTGCGGMIFGNEFAAGIVVPINGRGSGEGGA